MRFLPRHPWPAATLVALVLNGCPAPDDNRIHVRTTGVVEQVLYSFEGDTFTACHATTQGTTTWSCGDRQVGGCNDCIDEGTYVVRVIDGLGDTHEQIVEVVDESGVCARGGVIAIDVSIPSCAPGPIRLSAVAGMFTWSGPAGSGSFTYPADDEAAPVTAEITFVAIGTAEVPDFSMHTTVRVAGGPEITDGDMAALVWTLPVADDLRTLLSGAEVTLASSSVATFCDGASDDEGPCQLSGSETITLTMDDASGDIDGWPLLVSDDFVRTFRIDIDTSDAATEARDVSPECETPACDVPIQTTASLTFELRADDFALEEDGHCLSN
jgi:hypothetical protein